MRIKQRNEELETKCGAMSPALDTIDPDVPSQNPDDPRLIGRQKLDNAIFDQCNHLVLRGIFCLSLLGVF
jgi:hypothetical protein